jgi:hypothetical protein
VASRGAELYAAIAKGYMTFATSYALLDQNADYGLSPSNIGFYSENYPTNRLTSSAIAKLTEEFEFRGDLEFRKQYQNALRNSSDTTYILSSISANYEVSEITGLNLGVIIDNLGNEHFEEVPGVSGSGRVASFVLNYVW